MKAIAISAASAIAIQPILFFLWFFLPVLVAGESVTGRDILGMAVWVLLFASGFVFVLGIPIFLLLRHFKRASWISLAMVGFLIASVPPALFGWPGTQSPGSSSGGNWHGHSVQFVVGGVPTLYGWLNYGEGTLMFGLHGLLGALIFFLCWRRYSSKP